MVVQLVGMQEGLRERMWAPLVASGSDPGGA